MEREAEKQVSLMESIQAQKRKGVKEGRERKRGGGNPSIKRTVHESGGDKGEKRRDFFSCIIFMLSFIIWDILELLFLLLVTCFLLTHTLLFWVFSRINSPRDKGYKGAENK